jgi:hypothetical protein
MIDSVWWYVLAGFILGFILSTLWEWLYFRYRRMRIENQRISELEATVRSLSAVSRLAENGASTGFAAGYQSPGVFLEGEQGDVDTVEVIVPAALSTDQPTGAQSGAPQPPPETQSSTKQASSLRRLTNSANGIVGEKQTSAVPVVAATIVAASVLAEEADGKPDSIETEEDEALPPSREQGDSTQVEEPQLQTPDLSGDLSATRSESYAANSLEDPNRALPAVAAALALASKQEAAEPVGTPEPKEIPGSAAQPLPIDQPQEATQPPTAQVASPELATPPAGQEPEQDQSPKPALVALVASVLGSKLAENQDARQETDNAVSQTGQASPQVPTAPAASAMPGAYDLPDDQLDVPQDASESFGEGTASDSSVPDSIPPGGTPGTDATAAQDAALPLSAILPQASKPAPPNKNGTARRQFGPPAAVHLEPEIEQVTNQLDDLIQSINGLIEKTAPLLEQPDSGGASADTGSSTDGRTLAPLAILPPTADTADAEMIDDDTDSQDVTGPYTARNLSRTEYATVQLMQATRRLGRRVRHYL